MLSALPFIQGIRKVTINYLTPHGREGNDNDLCLSKLLNSDSHLRESYFSAIKLSIQMILSLKSLEQLIILGEG